MYDNAMIAREMIMGSRDMGYDVLERPVIVLEDSFGENVWYCSILLAVVL